MARTDIPVQAMAAFGAGDDTVTWTAGDSVNNHSFANDGRTILLMGNTNAGGKTATIVSVADETGRTGDDTITCAALVGISIKGPFPKDKWNQTGGTINVDIADATDVTFAAVRLPVK